MAAPEENIYPLMRALLSPGDHMISSCCRMKLPFGRDFEDWFEMGEPRGRHVLLTADGKKKKSAYSLWNHALFC